MLSVMGDFDIEALMMIRYIGNAKHDIQNTPALSSILNIYMQSEDETYVDYHGCHDHGRPFGRTTTMNQTMRKHFDQHQN